MHAITRKASRGFTLIELLVVIAIMAVLATVIVVVINPAELLRQSRDASRLSDLAAMNNALGLLLVDQPSVSLGTSSIVYVSISDSSPTCANVGLPPLPSGWNYACASTSTFTNANGAGWLPANFGALSTGSPLSRLPVDPVNATSSGQYYTYTSAGSLWELVALFESTKYQPKGQTDGGRIANAYETGSNLTLMPLIWPFNYVKVPGNTAFGTSDFYVMKYDAKCVRASDNAPLTSPDTGYHTYSDYGQPCTGSNYYAASAPDGYPVANITHTTALSYCAALGAHLLTNDEYMTIVRNAEQVSSNWSGGSPGSGFMYSGHNDNAPAYALTADSNDANGYAGETNTGGNQRRTFTLSNGSVVWDFAGNVWQHVQRSVMNSGDLTTTMAPPARSDGAASWDWGQYGSSLTPYVSAWSVDVPRATMGPSNTSWNSSQGVGQVYTYGTGVNQGTTVFVRGGTWYYGAGAGAFAAYLNLGAGNTSVSVGFRCVR